MDSADKFNLAAPGLAEPRGGDFLRLPARERSGARRACAQLVPRRAGSKPWARGGSPAGREPRA